MRTITSCHPVYKQKITNCLELPFGTSEMLSAKHLGTPQTAWGACLKFDMAPIMRAMDAAMTNIKLCVKEARPLTPDEWNGLGVLELNMEVRDLWVHGEHKVAAARLENFVYGPLFDKLSEVRERGRDLDDAALSFGPALYPNELLSPIAQIGKLAERRFVKLMREAGRTRAEVNLFKRISKDHMSSIIPDVGANAGIDLRGLHWVSNNTQLDYITRHGTHPARIARAGATLRLADWYIKTYSAPKPLIDYGLDMDD